MDSGSKENNETKNNTDDGGRSLQENEEDEDDDNNYSDNKGEYEASDCNISEDDKVTSENEQSDDDNVEFSSDDSSSKYSSNNDSDGLFNVKSNMKKHSNRNISANIKEIHTGSITNDNDMKPEAKNMKKSPQHNKSNLPDITFSNLFSGDLKQEVAENVKK